MELNELLNNSGITDRNEATEGLLSKFGLNWKVEKTPLFLPDQFPTGFFGIVRQDTRETFATCKEGYETFQNSELLELVNEAAGETGLKLQKGGLFKKGALVYLQLKNSNITGIGENKDTLERYVTAINSHNGSTSLRWGLTNTTISCMNTFWHAYHEMNANKVKHTVNMRQKVEEITGQIRKVQEIETSLYSKFFKLAEIPVTEAQIKRVFNIALDIDLDKKAADYTPYQNNRIRELSGSINREMNQKGKTLWGLFSGMTYYTTHVMPGGTQNRAQSKAIGGAYKADNDVFNYLLETAEKSVLSN